MTCKNLIWREAGYYRCSLPEGHLRACAPDEAHVAHDEELARHLLAEIDLRRTRFEVTAQ